MTPLDARQAIADLVHTYALHIRRGEGARCAELFTADPTFEIREGAFDDAGAVRKRLVGSEAISSYLVASSSGRTRVCPLIHNLLIDVNGAEATSTCVMTSVVLPGGETLIGEYRDAYRLEDVWRFSSRVFTILPTGPR